MRTGARTLAGIVTLLAALAGQAAGQFGGIGGFGSMGGFGGAEVNTQSAQSSRLSFSPWISANGNYTDVTTKNNPGADQSNFGFGGSGGVNGGKAWERTVLGGYYTGSYQDVNLPNYRSGYSQVGALMVRHSLTAKSSVSFSEMAGSTIGGYGYGSPAGVLGGWGLTGTGVFSDLSQGGSYSFGNPASNGVVDNEAFASRVNFSGTSASWEYQPNLRWNFGTTGSAMFVRRKSAGLSDLDAYSGGANVGYRISQRTSVGGGYWYSRFSYPQQFGGNNVHQAGLQLVSQLTQRTTFEAQGGAYYFNTEFLGTVQMDPSLAELLGQTSALEVQKKKQSGFTGGARLTQAWRGYSFNVGYDHGITPGNGLMLVSTRDAVTAGASTNVKRVNLAAYGSYYRLSGVLQTGSTTDTYTFGGNVGVRLVANLHLGFNGGLARYQTQTSARQSSRYASVNLTWSPNNGAYRF